MIWKHYFHTGFFSSSIYPFIISSFKNVGICYNVILNNVFIQLEIFIYILHEILFNNMSIVKILYFFVYRYNVTLFGYILFWLTFSPNKRFGLKSMGLQLDNFQFYSCSPLFVIIIDSGFLLLSLACWIIRLFFEICLPISSWFEHVFYSKCIRVKRDHLPHYSNRYIYYNGL